MNTTVITRRNCAIDAAIHRLVLLIAPEICNAQVQERGQIHAGYKEYTVMFDSKAIAHVKWETDNQFTMTLL